MPESGRKRMIKLNICALLLNTSINSLVEVINWCWGAMDAKIKALSLANPQNPVGAQGPCEVFLRLSEVGQDIAVHAAPADLFHCLTSS